MAEPGPFDKYQSPWFSMRESQNIDDRQNEPWPWHGLSKDILGRGSPTLQKTLEVALGLADPEIPPVTRLGRDLGAGDVAPITDSELMKFMLDIEAMNPYNPKTAKGK